MFLGKKILIGLSALILGGGFTATGVVTINNSTSNSTSFNIDSIGIYAEKGWLPAYKKAIEKYNQLPHKYPIEIKEMGSFEAFELIPTLGRNDQKVPDLIYLPIDRIPTLVQDYQALMGFETAEEIMEGISPEVYGDDVEEFAKTGKAIVVNSEGQKKEYFFSIPHATEALIMYYRGWSEKELSSATFQSLVDEVNEDKWNNKMYSMKYNDLWYAIGIIAGFVNKENPGAGENGQNVGKLLVSSNNLSTKYQSNMIKINDPTDTSGMQELTTMQDWNGGTGSALEKGSLALKKAVDFVATNYIKSYHTENKRLGTPKNDWLLSTSGSAFSVNQTKLWNEKNIKYGFILDGPWAKDTYKDNADGAIPIPSLTDGVDYIQAPGGWTYAINQRNQGKDDKIADMKAFINILLTDPEVIRAQYDYAGKIIDGNVGKYELTEGKYALDSDYDKSVLKAVYDSKKMDIRPDGGNTDFNNVWGAWDGNGWKSQAVIDAVSGYPSTIVNEDVLNRIRNHFITAFRTMLTGLGGK